MSRNCYCTMNEYLKTTLEKLRTKNYAALTIVMGNESCDLDSAVSAIVYAAFLHWQHEQMKCKVCTRDKRSDAVPDDIFIPLLNVEREDYELKTEVVFCLNEHGLQKDNLLFRDEPSLPSLLTTANITLVDHHVLALRDVHLAPRVTEIIDHRPIDKTHWTYSEDTRSSIELVGSCATLVAQRVMQLSALFAKDVHFFTANKACCDMLHSAIILDTANLSPELKKGTPRDEEVLLLLEGVLAPPDCLAERVRKLSSLLRARAAVQELSAAQLLRKDAKLQRDLLLPSLPILVQEFLRRDDALPAVRGALLLRGARAAVLLGISLRGGARRDLAVYCRAAQRRDQLCMFLQQWQPSFELKEEALPDRSSDQPLRYFTQQNLSASRKQYMPALEQFLREIPFSPAPSTPDVSPMDQ